MEIIIILLILSVIIIQIIGVILQNKNNKLKIYAICISNILPLMHK